MRASSASPGHERGAPRARTAAGVWRGVDRRGRSEPTEGSGTHSWRPDGQSHRGGLGSPSGDGCAARLPSRLRGRHACGLLPRALLCTRHVRRGTKRAARAADPRTLLPYRSTVRRTGSRAFRCSGQVVTGLARRDARGRRAVCWVTMEGKGKPRARGGRGRARGRPNGQVHASCRRKARLAPDGEDDERTLVGHAASEKAGLSQWGRTMDAFFCTACPTRGRRRA